MQEFHSPLPPGSAPSQRMHEVHYPLPLGKEDICRKKSTTSFP